MKEVSVNGKQATCIVTASKLCTLRFTSAHSVLVRVCVCVRLVLDQWIRWATAQQFILVLCCHKKLLDGENFSNIFFIYYFHPQRARAIYSSVSLSLSPSSSFPFFGQSLHLLLMQFAFTILIILSATFAQSKRNDIKIHVKIVKSLAKHHDLIRRNKCESRPYRFDFALPMPSMQNHKFSQRRDYADYWMCYAHISIQAFYVFINRRIGKA